MLRTSVLPRVTTIFLSLWLALLSSPAFLNAASETGEKGLFYYVVDRSGSIEMDGLTEPIQRAITQHVDGLPEDTEVRLVFFSTTASEPQRWASMTPVAKADFASYFRQNFVPEGATRLYDTVGEVMEEVRASEDNYRFVTIMILADGENNWSRNFRSWKDLEQTYQDLIERHEQTFVYLITLGFDPVDQPPDWVEHQMQPPGTTEIPIPEPMPQAEFTAYPAQLKAGETVHFEYTPKGGQASEFFWDFGDGNQSQEQDPEHRYEAEGIYTVSLRVVGPGGESEEVKSDLIQVAPDVAVAARFRHSPERLRVGDVLQLRDLSQGNPEGWEWKVNGEIFSTEPNPSLPVEEAGEISVSLTVTRGEREDTLTQSLEVLPLPPTAEFTMEPEEAEHGQTVVFAADQTEENWQHRWTIDGDVTLEGARVEWESDRHGLLHVVHMVEGPGGLSRQTDRVFIHPPVEVVPSTHFAVRPRVFFEGDTVSFRAGETQEGWVHEWLIDGERVGQGAEWEWKSDRTGNLLVTHRIRIPDTDVPFEESDEVMGRTHELVQVLFSTSHTSGRFPLKVYFRDESVGEAVAYHWDFGDGNSSTERNPVHTYEEAGNYPVVLTVTNPQGKTTANVDPTIISIVPPMPVWQKATIAGLIGLVLWVAVIVPFILRPIMAPERGPKLIGVKTYPLHISARRGWTRYFWPKGSLTIGSSLHSDIRLPNGNGKRRDFAMIERAPAASSYYIRPIKKNEIYKIEKENSLLDPNAEGKLKITGARTLKDGDTFEIGGERLTWCQPKKRSARRASRRGQPLTNATTYQS